MYGLRRSLPIPETTARSTAESIATQT
jgi:hypothetical protein